MSKKRGLGRGLGALIPGEGDDGGQGILMVSIDAIQPNPHQPRSQMDEDELAELAASIRKHGLIQPLIVTGKQGQFTLIAGERRWRASRLAEFTEVPVIVKEATPQDMLELAIIENIQRADLNALEEALAYKQLMTEFGLTQEAVADRVGKGRSTIANIVRLLELPQSIQQAVLDGVITGRHGRELLRLPTPARQKDAFSQIKKLSLSVRQTERLVDNLLVDSKPKPKQRRTLSPEMKALEGDFEHRLGTRVAINETQDGGRVVIYYHSDEELQAIYDAIVGEE